MRHYKIQEGGIFSEIGQEFMVEDVVQGSVAHEHEVVVDEMSFQVAQGQELVKEAIAQEFVIAQEVISDEISFQVVERQELVQGEVTQQFMDTQDSDAGMQGGSGTFSDHQHCKVMTSGSLKFPRNIKSAGRPRGSKKTGRFDKKRQIAASVGFSSGIRQFATIMSFVEHCLQHYCRWEEYQPKDAKGGGAAVCQCCADNF